MRLMIWGVPQFGCISSDTVSELFIITAVPPHHHYFVLHWPVKLFIFNFVMFMDLMEERQKTGMVLKNDDEFQLHSI